MKAEFIKNDTQLLVELEGRIDMLTATEFDVKINKELDGIKDLILNFAKVEYLSSFGLRVVLELQKKMNNKGSMKLINVNKDIMDIFDITGFTNILTIE